MFDKAVFLSISAGVRYWEDGSINGVTDEKGGMPFAEREYWTPIIELETGTIIDWPAGVEADIHYKVCDDGFYELLDGRMTAIAKHKSPYVPDMLSVGESGYGDYIIMKIGGDGVIKNWVKPVIKDDEWERC